MLKIKRLITVSLMFLISNIFATVVLAKVDGPSVFWKYSLWGKRRAFTEGAETLSKRLAEETDGKFQLKIFYGGQLAKSRENWDGLKANSFEMATVCISLRTLGSKSEIKNPATITGIVEIISNLIITNECISI